MRLGWLNFGHDSGEHTVKWDTRLSGGRHFALLISLLTLFVVAPVVLVLHFGVVLLNLIGMAVLLTGTYAVSERKGLFSLTVILAAVSVFLSWLTIPWPTPPLILIGHIILLILLTLFSVRILGNVLSAGKVTADRIYGAICVYLLIGYAWAFGYAIMEELRPGSFSGLIATDPSDYRTLVMQMRYFSFVSLTTVGYGDIFPKSAIARTFATLEAVAGQLYLAILVARLVGLHIVNATNSESKKN